MKLVDRATGLARRHLSGLTAIAVALAASALLLLWLWSSGSERRELEGMDAAERGALYAQTLRTTELLCANPPVERALAARCESFAQFLLAFPECDDRCQTLARRLRPTPTK